MPIIKSAIKKARQDIVAREHNRGIRDEYKLASKEVRTYVKKGDTKKAQEALKIAYSKIDKAAKRHVLHKNNASRRKARLAALLAKPKATAKTEKPETKKTEPPVASKVEQKKDETKK